MDFVEKYLPRDQIKFVYVDPTFLAGSNLSSAKLTTVPEEPTKVTAIFDEFSTSDINEESINNDNAINNENSMNNEELTTEEEDIELSESVSNVIIEDADDDDIAPSYIETKTAPVEISEPIRESKTLTKVSDKVTINIGGKKFNLDKKVLTYLNINYVYLRKIPDTDPPIYFLDKDPYYFSKIITILKEHGFDNKVLVQNLATYSAQFIYEMCSYGLLDKQYRPNPKLKLKKSVGFSSRHDDTIKIVIEDTTHVFEISADILSRSTFFKKKIQMSKTNVVHLVAADPQILRHVLNFLRSGVLYIDTFEILDALNMYGIEFTEEKNITTPPADHYIIHHLPHPTDPAYHQLASYINLFDPRHNNFFQFMDNKWYHPINNLAVSTVAENMNVINTESKLRFDSEIEFDLTKNLAGDCIEDLLLCIDVPANKPYVDLVAYKLIDYVDVIITRNKPPKPHVSTFRLSAHYLYLYPAIYTDNVKDYHDLTAVGQKRMELFYNGNLIEIKRIAMPLFLFRQHSHLPIKKLAQNSISVKLNVKMSATRNFLSQDTSIPLLNIYLIGNFINVAPGMFAMIKNPNSAPAVTSIPINMELVKDPAVYIYNKPHTIIIPIHPTTDSVYDTVIVPLDQFGFIKDFFITIIEKADTDTLNKFSNKLIELEILHLNTNANVLCKLDAQLLNHYIPLKKLGHRLPYGVYYYSFSSDPKKPHILGGLVGNGHVLQMKVKKTDGFVRLYVNEYHREIY